MQITYDTLLSDIKKPTDISHSGTTFTLAPTTEGGLEIFARGKTEPVGKITTDTPIGTIQRNGQRIATWSYVESKHSYCTMPTGKSPIGENPIIYLLKELAKH